MTMAEEQNPQNSTVFQILEDVNVCFWELSLKENEISWELNEISRPNFTTDEPSRSVSEPKLRMLLSDVNSFQNELRSVLKSLQQFQKHRTTHKLEEYKMSKINSCLTMIKNSSCYKFKSATISISPKNSSSIRMSNLIYRQPTFDTPIVNHTSLKQIFSSLTSQEPHLSSIIQVRSGGNTTQNSDVDSAVLSKFTTADKNRSNILTCALDLEEKLHNSKMNETKMSKNDSSEVETQKDVIEKISSDKESKLLEDLSLTVDHDKKQNINTHESRTENTDAPIIETKSTIADENDSEIAAKDDSECASNSDVGNEVKETSFIDAKTNKILGETLDNLNRIFRKLEEMEDSFSTNLESINDVTKNIDAYPALEEEFVDTEEYFLNNDEAASSKDIFFSAREYLLNNDINESL